jgi:hypothetical protein
MQGIYNCVLETNYISRVRIVVAILWLKFLVHVMLFPIIIIIIIISTFKKQLITKYRH